MEHKVTGLEEKVKELMQMVELEAEKKMRAA